MQSVKSSKKLGFGNSAGGADFKAGTAVGAFGSVDYIVTISFGNGSAFAFGFAGTASDAIICSNFMWHD